VKKALEHVGHIQSPVRFKGFVSHVWQFLGRVFRAIYQGRRKNSRIGWNDKTRTTLFQLYIEALAKLVYFVILNEVRDLNLLKIRDSSLRSE
jgi:hypothetical protein